MLFIIFIKFSYVFQYEPLAKDDYVNQGNQDDNDMISLLLANKLSRLLQQVDSNRDKAIGRLKILNMRKKKRSTKGPTSKNSLIQNDDLPPEEYFNYNSGVEKCKKDKRKSVRRILENRFKIEKINDKNIDEQNKEQNKEKDKIVLEKKSINQTKEKSNNSGLKVKHLNEKSNLKKEISKITNPNDENVKVMNEIKSIFGDEKSNNKSENEMKKNETTTKLIAENEKHRIKRIPDDMREKKEVDNNNDDDNNYNDDDKAQDEQDDDNLAPEESSFMGSPMTDQIKNDEQSEKTKTDREKFDEWLRNEYYKTLAKSIATMRRKRSDLNDDLEEEDEGFDKLFEANDKDDDLLPVDNDNENENDQNDQIIDGLIDNNKNNNENNESSTIEATKSLDQIFVEDNIPDDGDYVIPAIDRDEDRDLNIDNNLQSSNEDDTDDGDTENENNNKKKKRKRSAPSYFGRINDDDPRNNQVSDDVIKFSNLDTKLQTIEDVMIDEAMDIIQEEAMKESLDEARKEQLENRLAAAYDLEDIRESLHDLKKNIKKIENEQDDNDENNEVEVAPVVIDSVGDKNTIRKKANNFINKTIILLFILETNQAKGSDEPCYALDLLTSDCSSVNEFVPNGKIGQLFTGACNWHEVCYSCVSLSHILYLIQLDKIKR